MSRVYSGLYMSTYNSEKRCHWRLKLFIHFNMFIRKSSKFTFWFLLIKWYDLIIKINQFVNSLLFFISKYKKAWATLQFFLILLNSIDKIWIWYLSIFLRWGIRYIIYIFRTIVLIFVAIFITTFRPLYTPSFFRWLECRT